MMRAAANSYSLDEFFMKVDYWWPIKGKMITGEYREDAEMALKAYKYGTCYDK